MEYFHDHLQRLHFPVFYYLKKHYNHSQDSMGYLQKLELQFSQKLQFLVSLILKVG